MSEYIDELVLAAKQRMHTAGTFDEAAFIDFLDQIVVEWLENGHIHEDDDLEGIKEQAKNRWEEVLENLENKTE